ncbi:MAG: hypothetical protein M3337_02470 [Actinomycetota bacterium]|nr:hypothetical protein [Actinomycetota bacterium]
MLRYDVQAVNTATASNNRIHDDEVAKAYGFGGGLVPGVDVYAYLVHLPAEQWGVEWLQGGSMSARFDRPVYDGELLSITSQDDPASGRLELSLTGPDGEVRATGLAMAVAERATSEREVPDHRDRPESPPDAGPEALAPGTLLGSVTATFDAGVAPEYLTAVREPLELYQLQQVAHPGWLLRFANTVLAANVRLGPWIHVSSDVTFGGAVHDGDVLSVRAVVSDEYERNGHRFVELDVAIVDTDDGSVVQRVAHRAIHTPRKL